MPDPTDFLGIPNRDATPSIRGYVYQIYQSVLAWMQLGEDDVLILEGAEDFDAHAGSAVVTTQVKCEAGNVTLRSRAVIDAIQNFWTHQQSNPEFRVAFRFLTTADAGCEQGAPFGPGIPGLEHWASAAQGRVVCEPLRDFLLTLSFCNPLLEFIRSSSEEDLRQKLLTNIKWDYGARDKDALEATIEAKLKVHGYKRGIGTHHSTRVLPHLLKNVADLLSIDGTKRLCFGDFLSSFDDATTEVIPRSKLEALQNAVGIQQLFSMQENAEMTRLMVMQPTLSSPIPKVSRAIGRGSLVSRIAALLTSTSVVFLHGSSGVGKTNLALLVTEGIGGTWLWAGFRGRSPELIQQGLMRATYEIGMIDSPILLVLDDVEFSRISQFEREFVALIFAITQRNGRILVTSIARPPLHLLPKLWLPSNCEISVPYFDESEVSELLAAHGLSEGKLRDGWARAIFFLTSGHPQLVHARARTLSAKGWPPVSFSDLTKSEDIERVRAEARQRLLGDFPNDATRLLAYRLSIVIGAFSRQLALTLGAAPEAIKMAGEAFDHLVGPWIEREGEDQFRVSPLLGGAAENTLTKSEINAIHTVIANDLIRRRSLNQHQIGTAFFHAFMAKDLPTLAVISTNIVSAESEHLGLLYDAMAWFPHISLGAGQRIVEEDPSIDLMLRIAQFKLLNGSANTEDALKIVDRMEEALAVMEPSDQRNMSEAMIYGTVLNTLDIYIPSQTVVRMLSRLIDIATTPDLKDIYENFGKKHSLDHPRIADNRPEQLLFSYEAIRIRGLNDLAALFSELEGLPTEKRNLLLAVCDSDFNFSTLLIGRAWWSEVEDGNLNVGNAVATLKQGESMSRKWGATRLVMSCQVAISVIYDEYGHSADSALAVLDVADAEFPNAPELINQRSKVLFHANREQEALAIAERALSFPELSNVEYVYTCRNAGIAAAKLGCWATATNYFDLGARRALLSSIQQAMGIGLMADAAVGYWNQGKQQESISMFAEVLESLESIAPADDIKLHHLHAAVRHCISWIHLEAKQERSEQLIVPSPGMCSNQEPLERIKNHRIVAISAAWLLLHQVEKAIGIDCGVEAKAMQFPEERQPLFVAGYKRILDFEAAVMTPPWVGVIPAFVRMQEAMIYSREVRLQECEESGWQSGKIPPLPQDYWKDSRKFGLVFPAILAACINCLAHHSEHQFPVATWRRDLAFSALLPSEVAAFLDVLEGKSGDGSLYQEVGAGLTALRGVVAVETLWKTSFRLLNAFEELKKWAEKDIEALIAKRWIIAIENQRFAFGTPSLAVPAIRAACADETRTGLAKVAVITAVAAPYLSIRMAPEARAMLERIAAGRIPTYV